MSHPDSYEEAMARIKRSHARGDLFNTYSAETSNSIKRERERRAQMSQADRDAEDAEIARRQQANDAESIRQAAQYG